jgi:hypothetical protein
MPFDPPIFEAEVALGLILSDRLPAAAQDAMEAGFDGPAVVDMAILNPRHLWAIDRALQPMLKEIGLRTLTPEEAGLRLAQKRAREIFANEEDPFSSTGYFYRLWVAADYAAKLCEVGNFNDYGEYFKSEREKRERAREALEELFH